MEKYGDPDFLYHKACAEVWGLMARDFFWVDFRLFGTGLGAFNASRISPGFESCLQYELRLYHGPH